MTHAHTPWTPVKFCFARGYIVTCESEEPRFTIPLNSRIVAIADKDGDAKLAAEMLERANIAPEMAEAVREAAATLTEAANCLRPQFPSLADNVIEASAARMRALLTRITSPSKGEN